MTAAVRGKNERRNSIFNMNTCVREHSPYFVFLFSSVGRLVRICGLSRILVRVSRIRIGVCSFIRVGDLGCVRTRTGVVTFAIISAACKNH